MSILPRRNAITIDLLWQALLASPVWILGGVFLLPFASQGAWHFILREGSPIALRAGVFALLVLGLAMGLGVFTLLYAAMRRRYPTGLIRGGTLVVTDGEICVIWRGRVTFCRAAANARLDRGRIIIALAPPERRDYLVLPSSIFAATDFTALCTALGVPIKPDGPDRGGTGEGTG